MASMKATCSSIASKASRSVACSRPALPARRLCVTRAQASNKMDCTNTVTSAIAVGTAAATFLYSGQAMAAQELVSLAANDNRVAVIGTLFVPALGWVAFNMLQPLISQLDKMSSFKDDARPGFATAVGLGAAASMLLAENADAATEVAQLAASDNRVGVLATLFVPALGWVAFNILQPFNNQLERMSDFKDNARQGMAAAIGLGAAASMLLAENADAATEFVQLAEKDNRVAVIGTLFVPALAWVGFNMLQPVLSQLARMSDFKDDAKPSVASAVGLGAAASLLLAQNADAATEVAQLAASDNRVGVLATLFVPALGWVAFNILQPFNNQLERMSDFKDSARQSVATAVGLGAAASLLLAENADAATEVAQLAASDNRVGVLATLFVPALGWVAFNILQPFNNQLERMSDFKDSARQ